MPARRAAQALAEARLEKLARNLSARTCSSIVATTTTSDIAANDIGSYFGLHVDTSLNCRRQSRDLQQYTAPQQVRK